MTIKVAVAEAFGVAVPANFAVEGFADAQHPRIPVRKEYHFRQEQLMDVLAFLSRPGGDALYLTGPTGSGKTSLVTQTAARLNWPVQQVTCHGRLELNDLVGQFMLSNGSMQFMHGPLSQAVRDGHILILNEIDLMDPSELSGLNDIIEGQPLVIPQNNGEVIKPHSKFRLIATGNSSGAGDATGLYQGVMMQNMAFMDRFRIAMVGYPAPEAEKTIVLSAFQNAGVKVTPVIEELADKMIRVANEIRKLFAGDGDSSGQLGITMSTRTLVRWASLSLVLRRAPDAFERSLDRALTFRAEPSQREAVIRLAKDIFGDAWEQTQGGR